MSSLLKQAAELYGAGRRAEARACLRQAAEAVHRDPAPLRETANLAASHGDWAACREQVERLIAMLPADAPGLKSLLGNVCYQAGDLDAAEDAHRAELALDAARPDALCGLAMVALARGRTDAAEALLLSALEAAPGHARSTVGLADVHASRGEPLRAVQLLQPLVDRDLLSVELVRTYAGACRQLGETEQGAGLVRQFLQQARPPAERADALFALAGLYDAAGRAGEAFTAAVEANRIAKVPFDPAALRDRVDRLITAMPRAHARSMTYAPSTAPLVFIVGLPHSGTMLLAPMLAQHPDVMSSGEHGGLESMARRLEAESGWPWERAFRACSTADFETMAARYLGPLDDFGPAIRAVTDVSTENFWYLGLAAKVFPAAKVVWCRRDPLDVGVSCFMQAGPRAEFAAELAHIGHYIRQGERLTTHWRDALPVQWHECRYEALTTEPRNELARVLHFLGLPWHDGCLRVHESERFVGSPGHALARRPAQSEAVGCHRRYEPFLGPLKQALDAGG